ncbi:MAG: hypothetical protein O3A57_12360 [Bacteroidetes bacterium]|nr:hypothetical protein [Bacteroidota bacterium]
MGVATTDVDLRVMAAVGMIDQAPSEFQLCEDVSFGGVLLALPALLSCGLLRHSSRFFTLPAGFYSQTHIFLMLAFMALCRVKSIEQLGYSAPGEWGKLLGLDRCPAVKTLREKLKHLIAGDSQAWGAQLCEDWMEEDPANIGVFYADGHTRVYHGKQTKLPRHYVARQRLCLRATTDYWVNGFDGMPFFKVNCAVDPGMIKVLETEIVPTLEKQIPNQPTEAELEAAPYLMRFRLVFDREGYSPGFFKRMSSKRIACQTYHKYPGEDWPEEEFHSHRVKLINGDVVEMQLAERGTLLGSKPAEELWVREVRKRTESGRQIAIISTEWSASPAEIAGPQFGRWYQENFFKYGRQHFNLDGLIDYQLEPIDESTRVVSPAWRQLDGEIRRRAGKLTRRKAKLHDLTIQGELTPERAEAYMKNAEALREEIEQETTQLEQLKIQRREETKKHVEYKDLPEEDQFLKLANRSKHFIDVLKIIAYRAETAMAGVVREYIGKHHRDEARAFVRDLYTTEANLIPDTKAGTLTVELHSLATPRANKIVNLLCAKLNETKSDYPDTTLTLIFKSVSE